MRRKLLAVPAVAATVALALVGCSSSNSSNSSSKDSSSDQVKVVASFYPLVYLTQQIGGDHVKVENLTPSGEAHDVELSASQVDDVSKADLVVYEKDFQAAVDDAVSKTKPKNVVNVTDSVKLVPMAQHESDADHAEGEGGGEHEHGTYDPHFWLDPVLFADAIDPIADKLSAVDKAHADDYKKNAEAVHKSLDDLNKDFASGLTNCKVPTVVTAHEAYGYMADRYKFKQVGVTGIDPEQETSAKRLEEVAKVAKENKVTILFSESALSAKDTKTLSDQLGITTRVLDPLETQVDKKKDYIAVMQDNLKNMTEAMQCAATK